MDHLALCDVLQGEIHLFAALLDGADFHERVATCPGWTVGELACHLGVVHRWAEKLVRELASTRLSPPSGPPTLALIDPQWLLDGGATLLATLRRTDPDLSMWAWGSDQHVRFWARRQAHETLVHRIDLQLTLDLDPTADPLVVHDAIDEFLINLAPAASFSPRIDGLRGSRGRLALRDASTGVEWIVSCDPFTAEATTDGRFIDAWLIAEGLDLLMALYRRRSIEDISHSEAGDAELIRYWLGHLALD